MVGLRDRQFQSNTFQSNPVQSSTNQDRQTILFIGAHEVDFLVHALRLQGRLLTL